MTTLSPAMLSLMPGQSAPETAETHGLASPLANFAAALAALEQALGNQVTGEPAQAQAEDGNPAPPTGKILPAAAKAIARLAGKPIAPETGDDQPESVPADAASPDTHAEDRDGIAPVALVAVVPLAPVASLPDAEPAAAPEPARRPTLSPALATKPSLPQPPVAARAGQPAPDRPVASQASPAVPAVPAQASEHASRPFALGVRTDDQAAPAPLATRPAALASMIQRDLRIEPVETAVPAVVSSAPERIAQHALGTVQTAPQPAPAAPQDFSSLVDRLVAARDAAQGETVRVALPHAEFGRVSLHFRNDDAGLSVIMTSTDPGFARAVSAALPAQGSGGADSSTTGNAPHHRAGDHAGSGASSDRAGAGAGQGQARGQQRGEHFEQLATRQGAARTKGRDESGGIFA